MCASLELTQISDLVDATSIHSYSAVEAVEAMEKIAEKADDIKKQQREEMILNFIKGILFFIPAAGSAAGAAGLRAVRSMLRLIGTIGEASMFVCDVVENPDNAFITISRYLARAGVGRSGLRNAANARRGMSSKGNENLRNVKVMLDKATSIRGSALKA